MNGFHDLPFEILADIYERVSVQSVVDVLSMSRVNKRWKSALGHPAARNALRVVKWNDLLPASTHSLKKRMKLARDELTIGHLRRFGDEYGSFVDTLHVRPPTSLTGLADALTPFGGTLRGLTIGRPASLPRKELAMVLSVCSLLTRLDVGEVDCDARLLRDAGVNQRLVVLDCSEATHVNVLLDLPWPQLRVLKMVATEVTDPGVLVRMLLRAPLLLEWNATGQNASGMLRPPAFLGRDHLRPSVCRHLTHLILAHTTVDDHHVAGAMEAACDTLVVVDVSATSVCMWLFWLLTTPMRALHTFVAQGMNVDINLITFYCNRCGRDVTNELHLACRLHNFDVCRECELSSPRCAHDCPPLMFSKATAFTALAVVFPALKRVDFTGTAVTEEMALFLENMVGDDGAVIVDSCRGVSRETRQRLRANLVVEQML